MPTSEKAKEYQRRRNWLELAGIVLTFAVLAAAIAFGWSHVFAEWARAVAHKPYPSLALYFLFFSLYSMAVMTPLSFYSGFVLEHQYGLSNQTLGAWLTEWLKKQILSFGIMLGLVELLYVYMWNFYAGWWLRAWAAYALVGLVMGKLFPVLIIPLFYKYSPITDLVLKEKIECMAGRFGIAIKNISSLNLSKTTKKANAAFTGMGKTKRVILSDTLLESFTHPEIEVVLAHELGHYKHKDIWKQFVFGTLISLLGFYLCNRFLAFWASRLGLGGPGYIDAFPLLCLIFFIFSLITGPLGNAFSRWAERGADRFALDVTRDRESFVSAMTKLSDLNLADPEPHPLIEFFLYDHPAISRRIQMARDYR